MFTPQSSPGPRAHRRILLAALAAATTSCVTSSFATAATPLGSRVGPYEMEVLIDGVPAASFGHAGETYVLGHVGARYTLRVHNRSGRRVEAVVSVDGRDVIDGRPADFRDKRGYLIPAWGSVDIDGWRTSQATAAAFRFSSVAESYAARTGSAREVGVIGVAIFPERYVPRPPPPPWRPLYPGRRAPYDRYEGGDRYDRYDGEDLEEAPSSSAERRSAPRADAPGRGAGGPMPAPSAAPPAGAATEKSRAAAESDQALAEGSAPSRRRAPRSRPGLGTEFGEAVDSPVYEVSFVRANATRPSAILGARYDDRAGLLAMGVDVDGPPWSSWSDTEMRQTAQPFPVSQRRYAAPPPGWR